MDGDAKDSSGHGYNGTAMGNQTLCGRPGRHGKAIQLNGTDDYVDLPIGPLVQHADGYDGCDAWVNFSNGSTGGWQRVFDFRTGTTTTCSCRPVRAQWHGP